MIKQREYSQRLKRRTILRAIFAHHLKTHGDTMSVKQIAVATDLSEGVVRRQLLKCSGLEGVARWLRSGHTVMHYRPSRRLLIDEILQQRLNNGWRAGEVHLGMATDPWEELL